MFSFVRPGKFRACLKETAKWNDRLLDSCVLSTCSCKKSAKKFGTSRIFFTFDKQISTHKASDNILQPFLNFRKRIFGNNPIEMGYVVIGVSGITCGGKTSLTKLLHRKFPQAQLIHQDHYFYDDDYPNHVRCPESENHVNYEIFDALDMDKMYKDVQKILDEPPKLRDPESPKTSTNYSSTELGDKAETPNFDDRFLRQISDIDIDVSKYSKVPILIIEGFTIFGSQFLFDKCDARFFCSLDKETCQKRRATRNYFPPDSPNYFEKIVWPEYVKHFENFIENRPGVSVFDGGLPIEEIWRKSVEIVRCRIEEKLNANTKSNVHL